MNAATLDYSSGHARFRAFNPNLPHSELVEGSLTFATLVAPVYKPYISLFDAAPSLWTSVSLQLAAIQNGYAPHDTNEIFSDAARGVDTLFLTWSSPVEVALCLPLLWQLRMRSARPKIVLFRRTTSYGTDCTNDLFVLHKVANLSRFIDVALCDAREASFAALLSYLENQNDGSPGHLNRTLVSNGDEFIWHSADGTECGPDVDWSAPTSQVRRTLAKTWQAATRDELRDGEEEYFERASIETHLRLAVDYPWLSRRERNKLEDRCRNLNVGIIPFHQYLLAPPLVEIPDVIPDIRYASANLSIA